jgi:hypothetical protein
MRIDFGSVVEIADVGDQISCGTVAKSRIIADVCADRFAVLPDEGLVLLRQFDYLRTGLFGRSRCQEVLGDHAAAGWRRVVARVDRLWRSHVFTAYRLEVLRNHRTPGSSVLAMRSVLTALVVRANDAHFKLHRMAKVPRMIEVSKAARHHGYVFTPARSFLLN